MAAMWTYEQNDANVSVQTDSYYEERASEEEIYLEEREEEVRMILECGDPPLSPGESPNQQHGDATEELITGDSDDPHLSPESIEEMVRTH
jgi:hypothetical protein